MWICECPVGRASVERINPGSEILSILTTYLAVPTGPVIANEHEYN